MDSLSSVRKRLAAARSLTVLTGAGISSESGIPTFRGEEGLWKRYRAEDLATPQAFQRNPALVWEWYQWRRALISTKRPNAAHAALVRLEADIPEFTLITQNVDGLHVQAGSRQLIELHGNIWKLRCTRCKHLSENRSLRLPRLPKCPECQALLRPHIVWFGETIDPKNLGDSLKTCASCTLMLVIGTSALVQPAASFAALAKEAGAFVVEINPAPVLQAVADVSLSGAAAEMLPHLAG